MGEPVSEPFAVAGTVCRLTFFNDNLNMGIGAVSTLFGYDNVDGNDEGFTHGLELAVEQLSDTGKTGTWALGSRLYIRRDRAPAAGDSREEVPVWFTEEESLSYVVDTRRRRERSFVEYGGGLLYDSKTTTAIGASGQQAWYHRHINTAHQINYRYQDDGRAAWGAFAHTGYGIQGVLPLGDPSTAVAAHARLAIEPNTLTDASRLILDAAAELSRTAGATKLSAAVALDAVWHAQGIGYTPSVELAYERRGWGIRSSVAFPSGELQNHVRYNEDREPITSFTLFVRFAR